MLVVIELLVVIVCGVMMNSMSSATALNSTCSGSVQSGLLYNVLNYNSQNVGLPGGSSDENIAEAICCDAKYRNYAEPNGFFAFPDIGLFRKVDSQGITTFYDSVCGIPLFSAPIGRSFKDWKDDTTEHGWPSFRAAEVITENIKLDDDGLHVYSRCGTYLGGYQPDEFGPRWCIDLSCVAGKSIQ